MNVHSARCFVLILFKQEQKLLSEIANVSYRNTRESRRGRQATQHAVQDRRQPAGQAGELRSAQPAKNVAQRRLARSVGPKENQIHAVRPANTPCAVPEPMDPVCDESARSREKHPLAQLGAQAG